MALIVLVFDPPPPTPAQIRERRQRIILEAVLHVLLFAATFVAVRSYLS